jgi:oligo-1,6-glucosidase
MERHDWWKDAVVYQIYPRSFQDSNGDGIGDLRGILQRLDYIAELGADVIWLCPIYASSNDDNGYDISDYQSIQPDFGTMEDFDRLLEEAHDRGIRIIMDLVVNHTSDEHRWFAESRSDRSNPYRDYYIWREGRDGGAPNNWSSWFGGPAWQYDETTGMYYLHIFSRKQPDLNWDNCAVRDSVFKMMTWWLDKGVDGFRMDVISLISKPGELPDGPGGDLSPFCINGPRVHEYLREMNDRVLSRYDVMTVGECPGVTVGEAKKYTGADRHELNMVFQFEHTGLTDGPYGKWTDKHPYLPDLKNVFNRWQNELRGEAWNCLFWGNHDQPRAVSKFGCDLPEYRDLSAKMLCACLYLMQGTPYIYQGEELGMTNAGFYDIEEYRDVESVNAYHDLVDSGTLTKRQMLDYLGCASRDNARTPMQWSTGPCAGFTTGESWIRLSPTWRAVNAERERSDSNSVYRFYQKLLRFRKGNPLIREGSFTLLCPEHEQIFAYIREWNDEILYVACNFSAQTIDFPQPLKDMQLLFCNYKDTEGIFLRPFEAKVYFGRA